MKSFLSIAVLASTLSLAAANSGKITIYTAPDCINLQEEIPNEINKRISTIDEGKDIDLPQNECVNTFPDVFSSFKAKVVEPCGHGEPHITAYSEPDCKGGETPADDLDNEDTCYNILQPLQKFRRNIPIATVGTSAKFTCE